ncbi:sodium-coupled monocarboxylate transporter 2-like [Schistocerca piceifrons]|uniref:sodium-coupled monocarboxylate transporter 2-like n=1 Tax=Schistocerca piceifrons TaxID=274613 RepID=UPI001F5F7C53|nr:sodium-coupled monocarboxylate transporter 2-like [Schistocerca piceifrons]
MAEDAAAGLMLPGLRFGWLDHMVFGLMLAVSLVVGVYFGVCGRAKNTAKVDYLHGGKSMSVLPVAVSLVASHISGITLMGVPSEIYLYGTLYGLVVISTVLTCLIVNWLYLPVFFGLQLTSTYEYLERRFNRETRLLASFLFTLQQVLTIPLFVYVPALAFNQVSGVSVHLITPVVCIVCIFYTMLGGLKAVVWTDFLQGLVMIAACFAVIILGCQLVGSPVQVWNISDEGGRIRIFEMNPSPFVRNSFWTIVLGTTANWLTVCAINQGSMQKFLSVPNLRSARICLFGFGGGIITMKAISVFTGLLIYATYHNCDPISAKAISRPDQLLPYYVMQVSTAVPGLPGLFVAGIFSAALSSMSGSLNSLSGTIYEDFVLPRVSDKISDEKVNFIMQGIVLAVGVICVALVFVVEKLGTVLELGYSIAGVTSGALLGVFTLGMLFPWANGKGAIAGGLASMALVSVILVGAQNAMATGTIVYPWLPTTTDGCAANVTAGLFTSTTARPETAPAEAPLLFQISYMYYTLLGAIAAIAVGLAVSFCTGARRPSDVDPALLSPPVRFLCRPPRHYTGGDAAAAVELLAPHTAPAAGRKHSRGRRGSGAG